MEDFNANKKQSESGKWMNKKDDKQSKGSKTLGAYKKQYTKQPDKVKPDVSMEQ